MKKIINAWGGFLDGNLYKGTVNEGWHERPQYSIFLTKREAKVAFEDVRPIEIIVPE